MPYEDDWIDISGSPSSWPSDINITMVGESSQPQEDDWQDITPQQPMDDWTDITPPAPPSYAQPQEPSYLDQWQNLWINQPLTDAPSRAASWINERAPNWDVLHQNLNDYVPGLGTAAAMGVGFGKGMITGMGDLATGLSTPLNLATAGAFKGANTAAQYGLGGVTRGLTAIGRALSAPVSGTGAARMYSGIREGDWTKAGQGLTEFAGGLTGTIAPTPRPGLGPSRVPYGPEQVYGPGLPPEGIQQGMDFGPASRPPVQPYLEGLGPQNIPGALEGPEIGPYGTGVGQPTLKGFGRKATQTQTPYRPPVDVTGQELMFGDITRRPPPPDVPPPVTPDVIPERQQVPPVDVNNPPVVTMRSPDAATVKYWRDKGYVSIPGLISSDGFPQMVRGDLASLYTNVSTRPTPELGVDAKVPGIGPNAFELAMRAKINRPDIPHAIKAGDIVKTGDTIVVPNEKATKTFIANREKAGWKVAAKNEVVTIFKKFVKEEGGFLDIGLIRNKLRKMMGREPTPEEVDTAMSRQAGPGETTGRVAQFPEPELPPTPAGTNAVDLTNPNVMRMNEPEVRLRRAFDKTHNTGSPVLDSELALIRDFGRRRIGPEGMKEIIDEVAANPSTPPEVLEAIPDILNIYYERSGIPAPATRETGEPLSEDLDISGEAPSLSRIIEDPVTIQTARSNIEWWKDARDFYAEKGDIESVSWTTDMMREAEIELARLEGRDAYGQKVPPMSDEAKRAMELLTGVEGLQSETGPWGIANEFVDQPRPTTMGQQDLPMLRAINRAQMNRTLPENQPQGAPYDMNAEPIDLGPQPTQQSFMARFMEDESGSLNLDVLREKYRKLSESLARTNPKAAAEIRRMMERLGSERGAVGVPGDNPIVKLFREGLEAVKDFRRTRFILPDGTQLTHSNDYHEFAANELGTTLNEAMPAGIIRYTADGSADISSPITFEQAQTLADSVQMRGTDSIIVEVTNPTNGQNTWERLEGRRANASAIRNFVNNFFIDTTGEFRPGHMWETAKRVTGWGQGAEASVPNPLENAWEKIKQKTGWGKGAEAIMDPKEFNFVKEALMVPAASMTTGDFSYPGRQGLSQIATKEFWDAAGKMFKGLSNQAYETMDAALDEHPLWIKKVNDDGTDGPSFGEEAGLKRFQIASKPGLRAESVASRWLETGGNIPYFSAIWRHSFGYPIRATNRAFITFANHLSTNRFYTLANRMRDMSIKAREGNRVPLPGMRGGVTLPKWAGGQHIGFSKSYTPEQAVSLNPYENLPLAKELADMVNTVTGHAPLKAHLLPFKQAELNVEFMAGALPYVLFSPGNFASKFRMTNPSTYIMASPAVRKEYAKAAISAASAWYLGAKMYKMAYGDEVEIGDDWTSADAGKVKIGDTRLDLGGGSQQFLVLYGRMYEGGYTSSSTGEYHTFGEGFQAETQLSNVQRFMSNRFNPWLKFAYDVGNASQYQPFHVYDRSLQSFTPLFAQDLVEIAQQDRTLFGALGQAIPVMFGAGTQTYGPGESKGKLISEENDWLVEGGGLKDLMPWNYEEQ